MTIAGFERQDIRTIRNFFQMFLRDRFLASRLGSVWAVANPLMMLGIYTFVFAFVLKSRLPGADGTLAYSIWLIAGFGPWLAMVEAMTTSASCIHTNAGIIKNLAFKTECLPVASVLVGLVPLFVSLGFLLVLMVADGHAFSWHIVGVIPGILMLFAFMTAIGFGLSALVCFFRDLGVALPNLLMLILFGTPILYHPSATPPLLQAVSQWNPFFIIAEWIRVPLLEHAFPPLWGLGWVALLTLVIGGFTLTAFRRVKGYFHAVI